MRLHISFLLVIWCAFSDCASIIDATQGELVAVVTLYRHGDRAPKESFPTDQYFDKKYWPMGFEQLTNVGKNRQFELGKWLRSRYGSFLPEKYSAEDIYIRSTDKDRTLMSAYLNLAGLYTPKKDQIWNPDLLWQPIPVHTIPREIDDVITDKRECEKYEKLEKKVKKDEYFTKINKEHADLYAYLSKHSGWDVHDVNKVKKIRSTFQSYRSYNSSFIPAWAQTLDEEEMDRLAALSQQRETYTEKMKRLKTGPFFHHLFTYLENVIAGKNDTVKFYMFSAHDTTIAQILNSMDAFALRPPDYCATVIWELRKRNGSFYVNLLYKTDSGVQKLDIKSCAFDCHFADFKSLMAPITVDLHAWTKECGGEALGKTNM